MVESSAQTPPWSLLTSRGLTLLYVATHPGSTRKEIAAALDVSERAVSRILRDLNSAGAIRGSNGDGRRLHYEINLNATLETREGKTTLKSMLGRLVER